MKKHFYNEQNIIMLREAEAEAEAEAGVPAREL